MTIAAILLAFAALFAALGVVYGLVTGANPLRAAVSGVLAFMVLGGLVALPVVAVLGVQALREVLA
jgi:hypothetical protein